MTYLDVSPMVVSLRTQARDFELDHSGWLHHMPSEHRFKFDDQGRVWVEARCDCSTRSVDAEQSKELFGAYQKWENSYWRPMVINREFASHFRPTYGWRRLVLDIRIAWRRFRRVKAPRPAIQRAPAFEAEQPVAASATA